ncbi:hypothetical protein [Corynebacterium pseudokroppenstedtii]|uniref:hypothetical protein n=1 Tax=Corynebacterium pseudokroppenstedtii TaxID=2804917 RepID=UPI003078DF56
MTAPGVGGSHDMRGEARARAGFGSRPLTAEQLLIIIDEFRAAAGSGVDLVRPWACAAIAAAGQGRIGGIPTHRSEREMLDAVREAITRLKPLNKANGKLAELVVDIMTMRR